MKPQRRHSLAATSLFLLLLFVSPASSSFDFGIITQLHNFIGGALNWVMDETTGRFEGCGPNTPGIICDGENVIGLVINSQQLEGLVPELVGSLTNLATLTITNTLFHTIPDTLANLENMVHLNLSYNMLANGLGSLASGNFPLLQTLDLTGNQIAGQLPIIGAGGLPALTFFSAAENALTDISTAITTFAQSALLAVVDFSLNVLTVLDQVVIGFFNALNSFMTLILSGNLIVGMVWDLVQFLATLPPNIILDLSDNYLCGYIPPLVSRVIMDPTRLILNNNCLLTPLPNWCSTYATTCAVMRPVGDCKNFTASNCPAVVASNQSLAGGKLLASLQDGPGVYLVPLLDGQPATTGVTLQPTLIFEVDDNGLPVGGANATQIIPDKIFERFFVDNLTVSDVGGFRVSTILDNGAFFFWECYLSDLAFNKSFVNTRRLIDDNKMSQLMEVSFWPQPDTKTTGFAIDFDLKFDESDITYFGDMSIVDQPFYTTFSEAFASNFQLTTADLVTADVTLINIAYGNGNHSHNITHVLEHSQEDGPVAHLRAMIPFIFYPSLYYDPDIGVTVGGNDGAGDGSVDGSGGGSSSSAEASDTLIIGLSVGVGGGILVLVAVGLLLVVVGIYVAKAYRRYLLSKRVDVVNWDAEDIPYSKM